MKHGTFMDDDNAQRPAPAIPKVAKAAAALPPPLEAVPKGKAASMAVPKLPAAPMAAAPIAAAPKPTARKAAPMPPPKEEKEEEPFEPFPEWFSQDEIDEEDQEVEEPQLEVDTGLEVEVGEQETKGEPLEEDEEEREEWQEVGDTAQGDVETEEAKEEEEAELDAELQELLDLPLLPPVEPQVAEAPCPPRKRLKINEPLPKEALDDIKAACDTYLDHNSKQVQLAKDFSTFYMANKKELHKALGFGKPVDTKLGKMLLTDKAATAFLMFLQAQAPVLSKTLHNKFCTLKAGIRSTDLPALHMPPWAADGASPPPLVSRYLKALANQQTATRKPAGEKGYLTPDHVRTYCTNLMVQFKAFTLSDIEPFVDALFMRLQSGKSIRAINLFELTMDNVGFKSSGSGGSTVPYIDATITKPLAKMSVSKAVNTNPKSTILLTDKLTQALFDIWWEYIPEEVKGNPANFFFPAKGLDGFLWDQALDYKACCCFIQHTALSLGLVNSDEHLATFQLKSIRQGVAAESANIIRGALAGRNHHLGRAKSSTMELDVYAPTDALLAPGPLFDALSEDALYESALTDHFTEHKFSIMCNSCGYPFCECSKCALKAQSKKMPIGCRHTCWLAAHDNGTRGKRSKKQLPETDAEFNMRLGLNLKFPFALDMPSKVAYKSSGQHAMPFLASTLRVTMPCLPGWLHGKAWASKMCLSLKMAHSNSWTRLGSFLAPFLLLSCSISLCRFYVHVASWQHKCSQ